MKIDSDFLIIDELSPLSGESFYISYYEINGLVIAGSDPQSP
jgi:hypothetical protein